MIPGNNRGSKLPNIIGPARSAGIIRAGTWGRGREKTESKLFTKLIRPRKLALF